MNTHAKVSSRKNELSTKKMVITAVLSAIIVIMGYTPLGLIPLPGMTATILHIPVAIGAILYGPKVGLILGTVMGLTSLSKAILSPMSPLDLLFMNPLISVLPRALMGLITAYVFIGISKWVKNSGITVGITAAIASIMNTVLTLGSLTLIYTKKLEGILEQLQIPGTVTAFIIGIITTNGIAELIITIVIVIPIVLTLKKVFNS